MSKIKWDEVGKRLFEAGVDRGVLYPQDTNGTYPLGVAWNGLTAITESPSGAEPEPLYADNKKYLNLSSAEEFGGTIEAYTYPVEFEACDGQASPIPGVAVGQQNRQTFGLAYRTLLGNDVNGLDLGYKLHLVYGALAAVSEKGYQTIGDTPEAVTFSWEISTTPVEMPSPMKPSATLVITSTKVNAAKLALLEEILYGKDATTDPVAPAVAPRLPMPDEVITLLTVAG